MAKSTQAESDDLWVLQRNAFGDLKLVERVCPLCGEGNDATPASPYSVSIWTVKTCRTCRFTYIDKAPDYDALVEQMSWEKSAKLEEHWRKSTRTVQQTISKWTHWRLNIFPRKKIPALLLRYAAAGNVLDLGCGPGGQLEGLGPEFVPYGIEVSQELAMEASHRYSARGGYVVNAPSLEGLRQYSASFFTAAVLHAYLEHELHPAEVLRELHRTLKLGGVAIVKVPNFASLNRRVMGRRWCGFRLPDHLNYFTPATLKQMALNCGFETWFGMTWRQPTSDNMWALLRKRS